jgi:predicted Na+-dependent transporter
VSEDRPDDDVPVRSLDPVTGSFERQQPCAGISWEALGASALFLALSGLPAAAWARFAAPELRITGALVIGLRDFAVAAALAVQAFGPAAGTVAGVYGVLMLLVGAAAAQLLPRLADPTRGRRT